MRVIIVFIYLVTLTEQPTYAVTEESRKAFSTQTKLEVFAALPDWKTAIDEALPLIATDEDVRFARKVFEKSGLDMNTYMNPIIKKNEIEFPALKLSIKLASDGKSVQVGSHIFRREPGENFQTFAGRISRTLSDKRSGFYSVLVPEAQAYNWETADTIGAIGFIVAFIAGVFSAGIAWVLGGLAVAVGSVGFKTHERKKLYDYVCYEKKPGSNEPARFDFVLTDGTKVQATVADKAVYTSVQRSERSRRDPEQMRKIIARSAHSVAAECPDTKEFHEEFRNDIDGWEKRVNPIEAYNRTTEQ